MGNGQREVGLVDHERRCEDQQVAARTERHALGERRAQQGAKRIRLLRPGRQWRARRAIGDQLDDREQAVTATDLTDRGMAGL